MLLGMSAGIDGFERPGDSVQVMDLDSVNLARRVRRHCVRMTSKGGSSHVASCLSAVDIITVLYGKIMRISAENPRASNRDRFILSKGHAGAAVYATLAELGFFDTALLEDHYQDGSLFSGHVSHKGIPGVEVSTGSLGHGLGIAAGMAKAIKLKGGSERVFVVVSDGECDEGSVWESALFAAHHQLDNLVCVIDCNAIQGLAPVSEVLNLEPLSDKWRSFGWVVQEVNGHDHPALVSAFETIPNKVGYPLVCIARTVKGKGVSFMEGKVEWHYRTAKGSDYDRAMDELEDPV